MSWDPLEIKSSEKSEQLWRKIKRAEATINDKTKENDALSCIITELNNEIAEIKGELKRLRQSNAMLKKHRT